MTSSTLTAVFLAALAVQEALPPFRPPAVPLVVHDPYVSAWSFSDELHGDWPRHWTGAVNGLCGMLRIDGRAWRFAGSAPREAEPMKQVSLDVWPTRTVYAFEAGGIRATVTFLSPLLLEDADLCSRPVSTLTVSVRAIDGRHHDVSLYVDLSAEWCVNDSGQAVEWGRFRAGAEESALTLLRMGSREQAILAKGGDDVRIDWGHLYLGLPAAGGFEDALVSDAAARGSFVKGEGLPRSDDLRMPRAARDAWPVLACTTVLGAVGEAPVERHVLLAYDDVFSIEYFHRKLRPYWRRTGADARDLLVDSEARRAEIESRCRAFDEELTRDLTARGGVEFARVAALAYRQAIGATKIAADFDGRLLAFSKENFSNGCIGTVDVLYPAAPIFLLFNPRLLQAQLEPVFEYAASERWRHPFAPHDLGTYPHANGQVYGGGERSEENQMPVEESANMILLSAALVCATGDPSPLAPHAPLLETWAKYLTENGLDPANQLCTDDFTGHLARNANLSIKAILGVAAFGELCRALGRPEDAKEWKGRAARMAERWRELAGARGGASRLAFDRPGTWSQKYNLVWDRVLALDVFPADVARTEIALYKSKIERFGLPLDSRGSGTKLDWCLWTASLCESRADFDTLVRPIHTFLQTSPDRVPMTDWFDAKSGRCNGFRARSVVGGVFMPLLTDPAVWKKWANRVQRNPR